MIILLENRNDNDTTSIGVETNRELSVLGQWIYAIELERFNFGCFVEFHDQLTTTEIAMILNEVFGLKIIKLPQLAMADNMIEISDNWQTLSIAGRTSAQPDETKQKIRQALLSHVKGLQEQIDKENEK